MAKLEEQLNEQVLNGTVSVNDQNLQQALIETAVLDDLNDVAISSPTNGQILGYNSGTNSWQNTNAAIADGDKGDITTSGSGSTWTIDNNAVVEAKINTGAVTETKIGTGAVTETKIGTGAVTETKIGTGAVTETKIGTSAVTETKIANNAVTTNKIADNNVTTAKILDNNVTNAKLAQVSTATVKGRATAGTGDVEDLTIDADLSSVSANDDTIPSAKAVKAYVDILDLKTRIRNGGLINGFIRVTVASNNLTVAISTSSSSQVDPTAANPVYVWIGDTLRSITSALSISANAGTNWFNSGSAELATKEIDYFAYIGYNATDGVVLGFARIPYARLYSDFNTTTTNEKYARISTITNAAAGDNYVNVGRFAATLSAGAGYTWSVPTFNNANLIQEPIYETRWLTYVPTLSGDGGSIGTFTASPYEGLYKISNNTINHFIKIKCTNVGSWSGAVRVKPAINSASTFPNENPIFGFVAANGTNPVTAGRAYPVYAVSNNHFQFLTGVDTGALVWGTFVVNDHIRLSAIYNI